MHWKKIKSFCISLACFKICVHMGLMNTILCFLVTILSRLHSDHQGMFVFRAIASARRACLNVALCMFRVNQNETLVVKSANTMLTLQTQGVASRHGKQMLLATFSV